MAKEKDVKTNAMRVLDRNKISYKVNMYECDEFIDGVHIADKLGQDYASSFKTLVTVGKSGSYYVLALPVDKEVDFKKAAKAVLEKSLEMIHVKDINKITGYIRGGVTPLGMKKLYPTVIDETALDFEEIIVSGGKLGTQIMVNPRDLAKVLGAQFVDITAK